MNHAQDQGDEVHDEAVKDRHQAHFDTAGQDIARDIFGIALNEIGHLKVAQERPENAHHQSGEPISLTQAGAFQAAKNRPIKRMVMMIIPTGPPETKRVKRSVRGNMAKNFFAKVRTKYGYMQSRILPTLLSEAEGRQKCDGFRCTGLVNILLTLYGESQSPLAVSRF